MKKTVIILTIILILIGFYFFYNIQESNEYLSYLNERWELDINKADVKSDNIKTKSDWHSEQYILFKAKATLDFTSDIGSIEFKEFHDILDLSFKERINVTEIKYLQKYTLYQPEPQWYGPLRDDLYVVLMNDGNLYIIECRNIASIE